MGLAFLFKQAELCFSPLPAILSYAFELKKLIASPLFPADTKQTRVVKISVPTESFFNFFSPPQPPADDDESVASDIEERLELDYQLGEDIKEKLIPRAIDWFTGEALQFEELGEDIDPDEFEDEDDEDEDEDDDEDERGSDRDVDDDSDEEVRRSPDRVHS